MTSLIDPRCTGRCGAFATRLPSGAKIAQEKSNLSLIFVLTAVLWSDLPIYSAIPMNRLLYIANSTGSQMIYRFTEDYDEFYGFLDDY